MTQNTTSNQSWFVRVEGKVRGPFPLTTLMSMRDRGRISASRDVSVDRRLWIVAGSVPDLFAGASESATAGCAPHAGLAAMAGPPDLGVTAGASYGASSPSGEMQCFFSVDGTVHGPLPVSALQTRIHQGVLGPTDSVWIEGTPQWLPAGEVRTMSFPGSEQAARSWFHANAPLVACIGFLICLLFGVPAWFVVSSARHEAKQQREQAEAEHGRLEMARLASEKAEKEEKERIQKQEERDERLRKHKAELEARLGQYQMQMTALMAASANTDALKKKMAETEEQVRQMVGQQQESNRLASEGIQQDKDADYNRQRDEYSKSRRDDEQNRELKKQTDIAEKERRERERARRGGGGLF